MLFYAAAVAVRCGDGIGAAGHAQRADRQCRLLQIFAALEMRDFQTGAAEIAHDAACARYFREHPQRRKAGLFLAANNAHTKAAVTLDRRGEILPIAGLTHRRRGEGVDIRHPHGRRQRGEAAHAIMRLLGALGIEPARRIEAAAKAAENLFVEYWDRRPLGRVIDHQANRI